MKWLLAVGSALAVAGPLSAQSRFAVGPSQPCGLAAAPADTTQTLLTGTVESWFGAAALPPAYADTIALAIGSALRFPSPLAVPVISLSSGRATSAVRGVVLVTVTKDGVVTAAQVVTSSLVPDLDRALSTAPMTASASHTIPPFAHGMHGDSIALTFSLGMETTAIDGRVALGRVRLPGWTLEALAHPGPFSPLPQFPTPAVKSLVGDDVSLEFVVDDSGRVVPTSERVESGHYRDFIVAAIHAADRTRFAPARVAGCAVPQVVLQKYQFERPNLDPAALAAARQPAPVGGSALPFDSLAGEQLPIVVRYGSCPTVPIPVLTVTIGDSLGDSRWDVYRDRLWKQFALIGGSSISPPPLGEVATLVAHRAGDISDIVLQPPGERGFASAVRSMITVAESAGVFVPFPTGVLGDSIPIRLSWVLPPTGAIQIASHVECQAELVPGNRSPQYPLDLRDQRIQGRVLAQFVIDTAGRAVPSSIRFLRSTDPEFSEAVRRAVVDFHFLPAMVDGHPVFELVQEPFEFSLPNMGPPQNDSAMAGARSVPRP